MTESSVPLRTQIATSAPSTTSVRAVPTVVWLAAIVGLSASIRFALAATVPGPGVFPDEIVYSDLARSIASSGEFLVRDTPFPAWTFGPLYAVLIAPAYRLGSLVDAFLVAKAINSVVMSMAAIPAYLVARRLVSNRLALLSAGFAVLLPSMAFSARIMTESLFYPISLLIVLAMLRVLEQPTVARQIVVPVLITGAGLVRVQALVLLPAFVLAIVTHALLAPGNESLRERLRPYRATGVALLACLPVLAVGSVVAAERVAYVFGRASFSELPGWLVYDVAELDLALGVIPLAGFLLFASDVLREPADIRRRAFVAVTGSTTLALVVLAAGFATLPELDRIHERYLFYAQPLLVIGLIAWVTRTRSSGRLPAVVVVVCALLPFALFSSDRLRYAGTASTPGIAPWVLVEEIGGRAAVAATIGLLAVVAIWSMLRGQGTMPIAWAAFYLALSAMIVSVHFQVRSQSRVDNGVGRASRSWVDRAVGADADVALLWTDRRREARRQARVWQTEFFNRSVGAVYYLRAPSDDLPQTRVAVEADGGLTVLGRPLSAQYVLTDARLAGAGVVARNRDAQLTLYDVQGPVRLSG